MCLGFGELWLVISDYLGSAMLLVGDVLDGSARTLFSKFQNNENLTKCHNSLKRITANTLLTKLFNVISHPNHVNVTNNTV